MFDEVLTDDNYGYSVQNVPSLPSGWSLSEGISGAVKTAGELFGSVLGMQQTVNAAKYAAESQQIDLLNRRAQLDINRTVTGAQVDIAKLQASAAVKAAQRQEQYSGADLSTVLSNVNARIAGMTSSNSLMLWLTIAGVGIAYLQYAKGRK